MKSARVKGPMGTLVPVFMMLSISSRPPTPVSRQMTASLMYGIRMRFARKPGESAETEATLPIRWTKAIAVSMVSWEVCRPRIISTPFWTGTGFMKWVEITRAGACKSVGSVVVAAAILVMEMDDVLVARIACLGAIWARLLKIVCLRSTISGTASITKSTDERSSILVLGVRRPRAASAASRVRRCLETSFSSSLSVTLLVSG